MDALSDAHVTKLNYMSDVRDPSINLGTTLQEVISRIGKVGTPVNAVAATKNLALTGVVVDGETITINNPAVPGSDVYEFLADAAQTKTSPTNIPIDITSFTTKATVNLTIPTSAPTAGDTMTIGTKVYTFVPYGSDHEDGEVSVGLNLATAQAAIVAAINGTDDHNEPHPLVSAAAFAANVCAITALIGGTAGNSIASTETFTAAGNVFSAATLTTGADCTAANADGAIVAAITASDTQAVGAAQGTGTTVDLTADVAGVAGNSIAISETMTNGAFAGGATTLSGGVNGTVGYAGTALVDSTYVYFCVADNPITGQNWRRVSLGSAY